MKYTKSLYILVFWAVFYLMAGCSNQVSTQSCETFIELPDPTTDTLSNWSSVLPGLHASFVTIDKRFPKSVLPEIEIKKKETIIGWKGEKVSAQILLWAREDAEEVKFEFSDFKSQSRILPASIAQARFVRYVMTDEFAEGCGYRKPEDFAASLSPDMLDNLHCFDVEAESVRPVWVSVEVPRDAATGIYQATAKVVVKGKVAQSFELNLEVVDHVLPKPLEWTFHLDQWQHPSAIARLEGVEMWSDAHFEAMKPTMQMLADAGQKAITATLNKDPWNVQTLDPYADMIIWTKHQDGSWSYDYTAFDRWVQFMMGLGINKMINCYSLIPWNNEIHYKDETTGDFIDVQADPGTPIFKEIWGGFLIDFMDHLESKGWLENTNIAMDERDRESLDAAFYLIDSVAPQLGVSFADNKKTYQRYPNSQDISVSSQDPFSLEDMIDRRSRGLNTTFYVYCATEFPNQFTFSDPAESTYLGWYAVAAGFDGFLRWAFNSWVKEPMLDSRFRQWPAGDTYIVYPGGRSSIRYERMLEGIQDFEKINILREQLKAAGAVEVLAELDQAIKKMKSVERRESWNTDLNEAKQVLNEVARNLQRSSF